MARSCGASAGASGSRTSATPKTSIARSSTSARSIAPGCCAASRRLSLRATRGFTERRCGKRGGEMIRLLTAVALALILGVVSPTIGEEQSLDSRWEVSLDGRLGVPNGYLRVGEAPL